MMRTIILINDSKEKIEDTLNSLIEIKNEFEELVIIDSTKYNFDKYSELNLVVKSVEFDKSNSYKINMGVNISKFKTCAIVKSGCIITPNVLNRMSTILESNESIGAIVPMINRKYGGQTLDIGSIDFDSLNKLNDELYKKEKNKIQDVFRANDSFILINKEAFIKINGYDENFKFTLFEYDDFILRLRNEGYSTVIAKGCAIFRHFINCLTKAQYEYAYEYNKKYLFDKHEVDIAYNFSERIEIINIINEIDSINTAKILEVGCACGATLMSIKNKFPQSNLYGIEMNKKCENYIPTYVTKTIKDCTKIDFEEFEREFDVIIFADVLEHLQNPWETLNKYKNLLSKKGKIVASIPNICHYSIFKELRNGRFEYKDWGILDRTHLRFFTLDSIIELFGKCGMKIELVDRNIVIGDGDEAIIEEIKDFVSDEVKNEIDVLQYYIVASSDVNN